MEAETRRRRSEETRSGASASSTDLERAGTAHPTLCHPLEEARVGVSFHHVKICLWRQIHCRGAGLSKGALNSTFGFVKNPCEITQNRSNSTVFSDDPASEPLKIRCPRLMSGEILRWLVEIYVI